MSEPTFTEADRSLIEQLGVHGPVARLLASHDSLQGALDVRDGQLDGCRAGRDRAEQERDSLQAEVERLREWTIFACRERGCVYECDCGPDRLNEVIRVREIRSLNPEGTEA